MPPPSGAAWRRSPTRSTAAGPQPSPALNAERSRTAMNAITDTVGQYATNRASRLAALAQEIPKLEPTRAELTAKLEERRAVQAAPLPRPELIRRAVEQITAEHDRSWREERPRLLARS